ncbi:MAG: AGE family epimerase/isomerase [Deferribacteres bacterium]|nr:AGE family epimerase/isomerase [candidate division KSB1 bacterium]MCB9502387.1 AGE family epimerase/isomerase [Deferribacteres bacterium]
MNLSNSNAQDYLKSTSAFYENHLLNDIIPFWLKHSVDKEKGGFLFSLDQDGSVLDTDKAMWIHARFVWLLSTLYTEVEQKEEWLKLAKHGIDFIEKYGFDRDGRMFFIVTREGQPLRKRRYLFTESFTCMAYAAYAKAAGKPEYTEKALHLFRLILKYLQSPGLLPEKIISATRQMKGHGVLMINLVMCQILREVVVDPLIDQTILNAISEIENDFMKKEYKAVLETVGPNGEFIDTFDGRLINPGHAIETSWFIMREGMYRSDEKIKQLGRKIFDWSWEWGWDKEYGGIIQFRDAKNLPVTEYWHDMKFWWPQCEAIVAALYSYKITGDFTYLERHKQIHDYTFDLFPDNEYGEWFGYFHRDGRLSNTIKGNLWKGPFHIPRMLLVCRNLIEV